MPAKQSSLIDRALASVGLARAKPPARRHVYAGAQLGRLTSDWVTSCLSADGSIRGDFRLLRERARTLVRDNPFASRFVQLSAENIIGPGGIQLQCRIRRADEEIDTEACDSVKAAWDDWSRPEHASVDGLLSMTDIATLAVTGWRTEGEALIRIWPGFDNRFGFALQVLDPDLLDHEYNQAPARDVNEIRMGVERNRFGRPVAYHLWTVHPNDYFGGTKERVRVPAEQIIHLYTVRRPGQTRGITDFAPVLMDVQMLGGYQEAELVAARGAAANMGFILQKEDAEGPDPEAGDTAQIEQEPGTFHKLGPGETLAQYSPEHPVAAFAAFTASVLRAIAAGLNVSYSSLTGDLSAANYSSLREGSLKERDGYKRAQVWIAAQLYRRVYLEWIRYAHLAGAIATRSAEHVWLPRGWAWVDPERDITAAMLEVRAGFNTRSAVCAANGRTFEENIEQLAHEEDMADEYGVEISTDVGTALQPPKAEETPAPAKTDPDEARARMRVVRSML